MSSNSEAKVILLKICMGNGYSEEIQWITYYYCYNDLCFISVILELKQIKTIHISYHNSMNVANTIVVYCIVLKLRSLSQLFT